MPKKHKLLRRRVRELRSGGHSNKAIEDKLRKEFAGRVRLRSIARAVRASFAK